MRAVNHRRIAGFLAFITLSTPAAALDWTKHPTDKVAHVALGGGLAYAVTHLTDNHFAGIAAAAAAGVLKESVDRNFDGGDLASWVVGGLIGAAVSRHLVLTPRGIAWRQNF